MRPPTLAKEVNMKKMIDAHVRQMITDQN